MPSISFFKDFYNWDWFDKLNNTLPSMRQFVYETGNFYSIYDYIIQKKNWEDCILIKLFLSVSISSAYTLSSTV